MKKGFGWPLLALMLVGLAFWANARDAAGLAGHWTIEKSERATGAFAYPWIVGEAMLIDPRGHVLLPGGLRHGLVDARLWPLSGWTLAYIVDDPGWREPARLSAELSPDGARLTLKGPAGLEIVAVRGGR